MLYYIYRERGFAVMYIHIHLSHKDSFQRSEEKQ